MTLIFQNGDLITVSKQGNTYIGELANKIGHIIRRYSISYAGDIELINKVIIPNTNGLVVFDQP